MSQINETYINALTLSPSNTARQYTFQRQKSVPEINKILQVDDCYAVLNNNLRSDITFYSDTKNLSLQTLIKLLALSDNNKNCASTNQKSNDNFTVSNNQPYQTRNNLQSHPSSQHQNPSFQLKRHSDYHRKSFSSMIPTLHDFSQNLTHQVSNQAITNNADDNRKDINDSIRTNYQFQHKSVNQPLLDHGMYDIVNPRHLCHNQHIDRNTRPNCYITPTLTQNEEYRHLKLHASDQPCTDVKSNIISNYGNYLLPPRIQNQSTNNFTSRNSYFPENNLDIFPTIHCTNMQKNQNRLADVPPTNYHMTNSFDSSHSGLNYIDTASNQEKIICSGLNRVNASETYTSTSESSRPQRLTNFNSYQSKPPENNISESSQQVFRSSLAMNTNTDHSTTNFLNQLSKELPQNDQSENLSRVQNFRVEHINCQSLKNTTPQASIYCENNFKKVTGAITEKPIIREVERCPIAAPGLSHLDSDRQGIQSRVAAIASEPITDHVTTRLRNQSTEITSERPRHMRLSNHNFSQRLTSASIENNIYLPENMLAGRSMDDNNTQVNDLPSLNRNIRNTRRNLSNQSRLQNSESNPSLQQSTTNTNPSRRSYGPITTKLNKEAGISENLLQLLPVEQIYKLNKTHDIIATSNCSVCHLNYVIGDTFRRLPCMHFFHTECIDRWLQRHTTCPICRISVLEALKRSGFDLQHKTCIEKSMSIQNRIENFQYVNLQPTAQRSSRSFRINQLHHLSLQTPNFISSNHNLRNGSRFSNNYDHSQPPRWVLNNIRIETIPIIRHTRQISPEYTIRNSLNMSNEYWISRR